MDSLTRMRAFMQVVDSGGFSAAARDTGRSKALISKYVRELEDDLGVRLLNRTTRQLSLTEAGQVYYQEAGNIVQQFDDLQSAVSDNHQEPRGRLKVAAPRSFGDGELALAFADFMTTYREIDLDLHLEDRFADLVEEGFDVAIRIASLADSSMIARKLANFRIVLCAHPDVIKAHGAPTDPSALSELPCIVDTNARNRSRWTFKMGNQVQNVVVSGRLEVNSPAAARVATLAGLGFVRTPHALVREDLEAGRLVTVLDAYEPNDQGIFAVYPHRRHLSGKVRAFVDYMVDWFQKRQGTDWDEKN